MKTRMSSGCHPTAPCQMIRLICIAYYRSEPVSHGFYYTLNNTKVTWYWLSFISFVYFNIEKHKKGYSIWCIQMFKLKLNEKQEIGRFQNMTPKLNTWWYAFRGSHTLIMSYLEYIFVKQPCPKYSDTLSADNSVVPSQQIQGLNPLTVQIEGHRLVLHTVGYPVPAERTKRERESTNSWALEGGIVKM